MTAVDPVGPVAPGGSVTVTSTVAPAVQAVQADEEDSDAKGNGNGRGECDDRFAALILPAWADVSAVCDALASCSTVPGSVRCT